MAPRAPGREIFGWAMFDFANSSYTTVIVTVVFSVIFPRLVVGDAPDYRLGDLLWSVALAVSYGLVVVTAPVLGAIIDFRAAKKRFLFGSYVITVAATALLYFVSPGQVLLGVLLVIVSNYGFSVGESFASSFLPDLGPTEELGKISGYAWGLGYVGGIACTGLVLAVVGDQSLENFERVRLVGPITALFFLVAAIPTFVFLRERGTPKVLPPGESLLVMGFRRVLDTGRALRGFRDLLGVLRLVLLRDGRALDRHRVCVHLRRPSDPVERHEPDADVRDHQPDRERRGRRVRVSPKALGQPPHVQPDAGNLDGRDCRNLGHAGHHRAAERRARYRVVGRDGLPCHGGDRWAVPRRHAVG